MLHAIGDTRASYVIHTGLLRQRFQQMCQHEWSPDQNVEKEDWYWFCFEVVQSATYHRGIYRKCQTFSSAGCTLEGINWRHSAPPPLSMPWRMVGSTTDPTWSPRLCQRESCLPQLLSWRWCDVGAHLVVNEVTVNVAPLVVLFHVHAREVRYAWTCSQYKEVGRISTCYQFYHYNIIKCNICSMLQ